MVGPLGEGLFARVNIHRAFMGAAGFTIESGLSDATQDEADIKRLMTSRAREIVGIIDHTKWERAAFATFCPTEKVTAIISDRPPTHGTVERLRAIGVNLRIAPAAPGSAHAASLHSGEELG